MSEPEFLYRYECHDYCSIDDYGEPCGSYTSLDLSKWKIVRRTPKGAWIEFEDSEKFVLLTARKQFASETEIKALDCFVARKSRYLSILNSKVSSVQRAIQIAEQKIENGLKLISKK